jgi:hypothetical protein
LQGLSFCDSLLCIIVGKVADTLRWREICAGRQQAEVLCPHVLLPVQVLPEAYRSVLFCAFCCNFTSIGGRELRESGKEKKKKKAADLPELSDPADSCTQRQTDRQWATVA